jgi:hypothetical protein
MQLKAEKRALGTIPADPYSPAEHRIAEMTSWVHDLGPNGAAWVSDWWPTWLGFGVELIDLLGPFILVSWLLPSPAPEHRWWHTPAPAAVPPPVERPAPKPAAPAPTPARAKKPSKSKPETMREFGDVREWHKSRTTARAGSQVKPSVAYEAYKKWCAENDKDHVTLTAFGTTMKAPVEEDGCSAFYYEKPNSKRGHYMDIDLVPVAGRPKLRVAADNTAFGSMQLAGAT